MTLFQDFVMFKPQTPGAIWVPIWKFRWGWEAGAVNDAGVWKLKPGRLNPTSPTGRSYFDDLVQGSTVQFPEWEARQQDIEKQPDWWRII